MSGYLPDGLTDWAFEEAMGGHDPCPHKNATWMPDEEAPDAVLHCGDCGEEWSGSEDGHTS